MCTHQGRLCILSALIISINCGCINKETVRRLPAPTTSNVTQTPSQTKTPSKRTLTTSTNAPATKENKQCKRDRTRIENNYQQALNKTKHRACTRDLECILLPAYTFCSSVVCLNRSSTVNRAYAKQVKDIQYQADLKACEQLTRACATPLYQKRLATTCSKNRARAHCDQGQCVIKNRNPIEDRH